MRPTRKSGGTGTRRSTRSAAPPLGQRFRRSASSNCKPWTRPSGSSARRWTPPLYASPFSHSGSSPLLFEDSAAFFAHCPVPIFIVSNIDQDDVQQAVAYHKLKPAAIFTSEQARSYKPRAELFRLAMHTTGLKAENLLHVGDSYQNDVVGARAAGLSAVWLNRTGKTAPDDTVRTVKTLTELLPLLDGKEV